MISSRTTLVLGAGASMPYGFPSGAELREQLCSIENLSPLLDEFPFDKHDIKTFCREFHHSGLESIDAFLARRGESKVYPSGPTFSDIGKAGIALLLIKCERHKNLFRFGNEDPWYQYLWRYVVNSLDGLQEKKLTIITFNYDRSLECYLLTTMQSATGVTLEEAAARVREINIIHVYGRLGALKGLESEDEASREYLPVTKAENIRIAAAGIKVMAESHEDSATFSAAKDALRISDRVCFLGFGFDSLNTQRLGIEQSLASAYRDKAFRGPFLYSTTLGMKDAERASVIELLSPKTTSLDSSDRGLPHYLEKIRMKVARDISAYPNEKNMNYLRHVGILNEGNNVGF